MNNDSQVANDLPSVFTPDQEERIRKIIREEIQQAKLEELDASLED